MNDRRTTGLAILVLALAMTAGCAGQDDWASFQGPDRDGGGSLTVALDGNTQILSNPFRIRLYRGVPASLADKPYFESACTPARRGFSLDRLKTGTDYLVVFETFSSATCLEGTQIAMGVRGDIEITKDGTGEAVYYIQVNATGDFSRFPIPGTALSSPNPPVPCTVDVDCQQLVDCPVIDECRFPRTVECDPTEGCADGTKVMQYEVHPAATCIGGYCKLSSLFPLNSRVRRAFHIAESTSAGDVSMLGGVTEARAQTIVVAPSSNVQENPDAERFGGSRGLFSSLELDRDLGSGLALTATGRVEENTVVLAGGTASIGMDIVGDQAVPWPGPATCGDADCPMALSALAWVVDLEGGTAIPSDLPVAMAAAQVVGVPGVNGFPRVFVRAGLVQSTENGEVRLGRDAFLCDLNEESQLSCATVGEVSERSGRFLATGACLVEAADGLCEQYLILGGNTQAATFAELFNAADGSLTSLTSAAGVPETLFGAKAVNVGGRIVAFGGGSQPRKADVAPIVFSVNLSNMTINAESLGLTDAQNAPLLRQFHAVTVLANGTDVLVTGGLDASLVPTQTATWLRFAGDTPTVIGQWDGLAVPRAGHEATLLRGGLLGGSVLVSGGLTSLTGVPTFAEGSEIFVP